MKIKESVQKVIGRSIFDSRGVPTVEVDIKTTIGQTRASCPSGASTGTQEAHELRDGDMEVCMGKGVQKALMAVEEIISSLITKDLQIIEQEKIDEHMIKLDGTKNKSRLGANSILPISICFARLGAMYTQMEDWAYLRMLMNEKVMNSRMQPGSVDKEAETKEVKHLENGGVLIKNPVSIEVSQKSTFSCEKGERRQAKEEHSKKSMEKEGKGFKVPEEKAEKKLKISIPKLFFNIINGGMHADNGLFVQEVMVSFEGSTPYKVLAYASDFIYALKDIVKKTYKDTGVGDEGGFAPPIESLEEALDLVQKASKASGLTPKVALDIAASEFYENGKYNIGWKGKSKFLTTKELIDYYIKIIDVYEVSMIEDPFDEKDYDGWTQFMEKASKKGVKVVGDDLIVTNPSLIKKAGEKGWCNVALIKMNQIGTITETIKAVKEARKQGLMIMVSHRSGETEDVYLSHLSVGLQVDYLKAGSLCRTERVCKYNELVRIFEKFKIDTI